MTDEKISDLSDGGTIAADDEFAIARSGDDFKIAGQRVKFTLGSSPPSSPSDGDEWVYPADASNGVYWRFVYVSSQTTYKWVFVGGPPMYAGGVGPGTHINANTQVGATSYYYDPSTMKVTVGRAGDYDVHGVVAAVGSTNFVEAKIFHGSTVHTNNLNAIWNSSVEGGVSVHADERITGISASTDVGIAVHSGADGSVVIYASALNLVQVTPVRVI